MFKAFKKMGAGIKDASNSVGKGIQTGVNKTGGAFKKHNRDDSKSEKKDHKSGSRSPRKHKHKRDDKSDVSISPPNSRGTTPRPSTPDRNEAANGEEESIHLTRSPSVVSETPRDNKSQHGGSQASNETPTPVSTALRDIKANSATPKANAEEEEEIQLDLSDKSGSSIKFENEAPLDVPHPVREDTVTFKVEDQGADAGKEQHEDGDSDLDFKVETTSDKNSASTKSGKTKKTSRGSTKSKDAAPPSKAGKDKASSKSNQSREESSRSRKSRSPKTLISPPMRTPSRESARSAEKAEVQSQRERGSRPPSAHHSARSHSENSRASSRSASTHSHVSIGSDVGARERSRKKVRTLPAQNDQPTSFDIYSTRKTKSHKSPRKSDRRNRSPRTDDYYGVNYRDLLQQCQEDAEYLSRHRRLSPTFRNRGGVRPYSPGHELENSFRSHHTSRNSSRRGSPRRSARNYDYSIPYAEEEQRWVSPYRQGNYNWRARDVYDDFAAPQNYYDQDYLPLSPRERYRSQRRDYPSDLDHYADELNHSRNSGRGQGRVSPVALASPRGSPIVSARNASLRGSSRRSSPMNSPLRAHSHSGNTTHFSPPVEARLRSPLRNKPEVLSQSSQISESDLLDEVEWKLDALAQEILVEDTVLEEKMRSNTFERLYHMNNRRDRDERRKKLVQYTSLEKVRKKLLDGSIDREIEERENRKRQEEALLTDPSGVFLRLYNNSYSAARKNSPSGRTQRSGSATGSNHSGDQNLHTDSPSSRPNTPRRSSAYIKEVSKRLYQSGPDIQNRRKERMEQSAQERERKEMEDFLVARLMARIERNRMVKGRILSYEELEAMARQQVRQQMAQDQRQLERDLIRGPRLSAEDQKVMSKRLYAHGYVDAKLRLEEKEKRELEKCTFKPEINPRSAELASNELERYIDKVRPDGSIREEEDAYEEPYYDAPPVDRCEVLYNKASKRDDVVRMLAEKRDEELRHKILQSKLENDHHFRRRVELDPSLADRFMRSIVV